LLVEKPSGAAKGSAVDLAHDKTLTSGSMQNRLRICAATLKIFQLILKNFEKSVDRIKNNFYI
jgi:hypothetical protein